jgi:hypothetical protein
VPLEATDLNIKLRQNSRGIITRGTIQILQILIMTVNKATDKNESKVGAGWMYNGASCDHFAQK